MIYLYFNIIALKEFHPDIYLIPNYFQLYYSMYFLQIFLKDFLQNQSLGQ